MEQHVWLITGTSTGLGRALAEAVIAHGDRLVTTARKEDANRDLEEQAPDRVCRVVLDVTRPEQIQAAVTRTRSVFGRLDILVNNAGYGLFGGVEEVTEAQIRRQVETNLIGSMLMTKAVLPLMREQRSGHILQISSSGGQMAFAGTSIYHATK